MSPKSASYAATLARTYSDRKSLARTSRTMGRRGAGRTDKYSSRSTSRSLEVGGEGDGVAEGNMVRHVKLDLDAFHPEPRLRPQEGVLGQQGGTVERLVRVLADDRRLADDPAVMVDNGTVPDGFTRRNQPVRSLRLSDRKSTSTLR